MPSDHKTVLVVAAHPDDEALGCGGTLAKWVSQGTDIHLLFFTNGVGARGSDKGSQQRNASLHNFAQEIGIKSYECLDFPDNQMDSVPLLDCVKPIERKIAEIKPDTILTHHAGDLNIDHRICHQAVLTACRPLPNFCVKTIMAFEVLSSTEWGTVPFVPNVFVDISDFMDKKLQSLRHYNQEMRPAPHARSYENIKSLATFRGHSVGVNYAEGFMIIKKAL